MNLSLHKLGMPLFVLPTLLFVVLAGPGCDPKDDGPGSQSSSEGPVPGGTAVVALAADPDVLNPLIHQGKSAGMVYAEIHDGLTEMADDLTYQPRIASSWTLAPDGMAITYRLRPWVWSDGRPLTSRDVVLSFDLFKDPRVASPRRGFYGDVVRATALDDSTVRYDLERPVPDILERTWHHILPAHLVENLDPAEVGSWDLNRNPLSSGEFMLEEWAHNRSLSLVRNPRYPGRAALLDRVVFSVLPEESTRLVALETGEVDLMEGVPADAARRLEASGKVDIEATGGRRIYFLQWNCSRPALRDASTRRALSLALDRIRMIDILLLGFATPGIGPLPPVVWNHHGKLEPDPFDPSAARTMLAGVGWKDEDGDGVLEREGRPFEIEILTRQGDPVRENGVVMLREFLAAVGVKVEVRVMELAAGLELLRAGRFDAYFGRLNANLYGDPRGYVHSTAVKEFNSGRYASAEVDSLLDLARTVTSRQDALPLWHELQEVLNRDPPAAYLFYPDNLVGVSRRLNDVRPHLLSPINNLSEWWIAPADRRYKSGR